MMEAPDSPPETQNSAAGLPFSPQSPGSSQQTQQANTSRANSDSAAKVNHGAPGSSWSSKRFHDDYERAMNSLLDQNWDQSKFVALVGERQEANVRIAKYGDPLLK
jgi:hypothetical protein